MYRQGESERFKGKRGLIWLYRLLMLGVLMACMLLTGVSSLNAAEYAVVFAVYLLLLTMLHGVYGACNAGQFRVPELFLSQTLSNLICAAVTFLCVSLYTHQLLPMLPMLILLAVQELLSVGWSIWVNVLYYRFYKPPRTAIVYKNEALLQQLYATPHFLKKYNVCRLLPVLEEDSEELLPQLADCDAIFVAGVSARLENRIAKFCVEKDKKGFFLPRIGQIVLNGAEYVPSFSMPMLMVHRADDRRGYSAVKRVFDILASLVGIVLTLPITLVTALAIYLEDHGPVFYCQTRLTKDGREFPILKFRSMRVDAEKDGVARLAGAGDSRITRVGRFIRACRIDELPQLLNILRGDMSIVGPRPERPEIARQYEKELPEFALRLQVKAGLTGLAQVYGRYNTDPYSKLRMDLMYINDMSLMRDLSLILATVKTVFMKESTEGIAQDQRTAMADKNAKSA